MPSYDYACPECKTHFTSCVRSSSVTVKCKCGEQALRQPCLKANYFLPNRDKAIESGSNARYREWVKSPEVQAQLRSGELVRESSISKASNSLTDHIECLDVDAYQGGDCE